MELIVGNKYYIELNCGEYIEAKLAKYTKYSALLEIEKNSYIEKQIFDVFETEEDLISFKEELRENVQEYTDRLELFTDMFDDLVDEFGGRDGYNSDDVLNYVDRKYEDMTYNIINDKLGNGSYYFTIVKFELDCIGIEWDVDKNGNIYDIGIKILDPFEYDGELHFSTSNYWNEPNRYKNNKIREFEYRYRESRLL